MFHLDRKEREQGKQAADLSSTTTTAPPMIINVTLTVETGKPGPAFKILLRLMNQQLEWKEYLELPLLDPVSSEDSVVYRCTISNAADIGDLTQVGLLYVNSGIIQGDLVLKRLEIQNVDKKKKWICEDMNAKFQAPATQLNFNVVELLETEKELPEQ